MTRHGDQFYFYDEFGQVSGHRRGQSHATFEY
jgi:hypothetical protein